MFLLKCTRPPQHDTYVLLKFQYFHRWKTVTINDALIPISITAAEARTSISVSPAKFGNIGDRLNLPWFNRADAALFSSEMHPKDQCSLNVRLARRRHTEDTFDIVPCTPYGFANLAARLLTVVLRPGSDNMPRFEFSYVESFSPSATYIWRSGILLSAIRYYLIELLLLFGVVLALVVCASTSRVFLPRHVLAHSINSNEKSWSHLEPRFKVVRRFWRAFNAPIQRLASFVPAVSSGLTPAAAEIDLLARQTKRLGTITEEDA